MTDAPSLPLFPLQTVLVPGAALDLRIFERRYLDMVGECGRNGCGFGVCLILEGNETGTPATPVAFGTEAVIEDFGNTPEGLLSLRVRGKRRFHVLRTRVRDTGLIVADIEWRADAAASSRLRPEHALLVELLRRILLQVDAGHIDPDPALFEDAAWTGWRLAELLPLSMQQRQVLLQLDDPHARLQLLLDGIAAEIG
ncbi:LON peptidase substrate-binding domain-containing protein [Thermomonas carbonis]|uniref:LON peptidase substrate-binding domain-containing protein n=1 Tax=Thermomonas carbonis TaxID=1463158 RepID=A0A7G9SRN9_9GAMM|nr:LON peptidase substrate-binding domain-containing protein [Thermomonas carbonis]QNN70514.1 LON peptidase substrate-binding domain-containing protein [Thermomonas carbonis]GHC00495.1 ATP-dependent protease [Thermomonas carbonis]